MRQNRLIAGVVVAAVLSGCGGKGGVQQKQHEYEVVQEGAATGVTSTIQGPGETLPPITGTNADTTTAFTINPNTATPGAIAGTTAPPPMTAYPPPTPMPPPMTSATPQPPRPAPVARQPAPPPPVPTMTAEPEEPAPADEPAPAPAPPAPKTTPPAEPEPEPTQTDTQAPPPPPPYILWSGGAAGS
jgi:hypothetical protein